MSKTDDLNFSTTSSIEEIDPYKESDDDMDPTFSPEKKKRKTNKPAEKRIRTQVNRYGKRDSTSNHDNFFTHLTESRTHDDITSESNTETRSGSPLVTSRIEELLINRLSQFESQFIKLVNTKFEYLDNKIELLRTQVARVESKVNCKRDSISSSDESNSNESYFTVLGQLGLPVDSKQKVDQIEIELGHEDYYGKLVIYLKYRYDMSRDELIFATFF